MKKLFATIIIFVLLLQLPFAALAEDATLKLTAPEKVYYTVGEEPDYTGGSLVYSNPTPVEYPLQDYCTWPDMSTPGNKTVTVQFGFLSARFTVVVLSADQPIETVTDLTRSHWSYQYFGPCMKAGYFAGDEARRLNPDTPITRAEMAQIIYRAWQTDPKAMSEKADAAAPFVDVQPTDWYYEAVEACRKAGILRGMEEGRCNPTAPITRQDAVLMLMRIRYTDAQLKSVNINQTIKESGLDPVDIRLTSDYARSAMALALGTIIFGNEQNKVLPHASITRAECAAIFHRLFLKDYQWEAPAIPEEAEPDPEPELNTMPLVYLSPSNQFSNSYAAGNTNEGDQMYRVGEALKTILLQKGYRVYLADRSSSINDRPTEAANMGADLYIPIHSNSGGNTGTFVFYNGSIEGCKEFSREIFDRLAALTGTAYSTNRHKEDYLSLLPDGAPFKEVMNPTMPMAFIEVEFHDKADTARWIINNTQAIANAIADGVVAYSEKYLIK